MTWSSTPTSSLSSAARRSSLKTRSTKNRETASTTASSVRVARSAEVVGPAVPGNADHPTPAAAEHHPAEEVGALGLRVDVAVAAGSRPLLGLPARGEFVVHPLREQRLVGGFERPDP